MMPLTAGDRTIGTCPACGEKLSAESWRNPREKGDDDGVEYGHPRDRMDGIE